MSDDSLENVNDKLSELVTTLRDSMGFGDDGPEPLLRLTFLALPSGPDLGLLDRGVIDTRTLEMAELYVAPDA